MKTALEMAEFCKNNNTGTAIRLLEHFGVVESQIYDDEQVLFAFSGMYDYKSVTKHQGDFAVAVTSNRIILGQKKIIGDNSIIINKININDINKKTGLLMGIIEIDTLKETVTLGVTKSEANNIYSNLNNILWNNSEINEQSTENKDNKFEELKQYKELLDLEIISEEEFEEKKRQILS